MKKLVTVAVQPDPDEPHFCGKCPWLDERERDWSQSAKCVLFTKYEGPAVSWNLESRAPDVYGGRPYVRHPRCVELAHDPTDEHKAIK